MTDTDRKRIKDFQKGQFLTIAEISNSAGETENLHKRTYSVGRPYAANDSAAFSQQIVHTLRKVRVKAIKIDAMATVTGNAANYELFTFATQYPNGTAGKTLGTWNTAPAAQNTITANVTGSVTVVTNSDADIPADMKILVTMAPQGTGMNAAYPGTSFTVDLEEI
jgi:hypothetical protein